jgi:hypothetical protein
MKKLGGTLMLLAALAAPAICGAASNPAAEEKAVKAAESWLALVDEGKYAQSWTAAAALLKNAVSEADWDRQVRGVRKPLGKVVSRTLKSKQYATSLPGAPDGQYVVLQYDTSFENKKSATETVTPMLEKDGSWRVSGYYIR